MNAPIRILGGKWNDQKALIVYEQDDQIHYLAVLKDRIEDIVMEGDRPVAIAKAFSYVNAHFPWYSTEDTFHYLTNEGDVKLHLSTRDQDEMLGPIWDRMCRILPGMEPYAKRRP